MIDADPLTAVDLERFHRGDSAFFRGMVEEYTPRLLALAQSFAQDPDDAHDLLQETWWRVYEKRRGYRGTGSLVGWLYAVSRRVCLSAVSKKTSREHIVPDLALHSGSPSRSPEAELEGRDFRRSVNRALMELPDRERDVFIFRVLHGLSTRETAVRLGCAEGTVKATLHHAVKKLQIAMEVWVR